MKALESFEIEEPDLPEKLTNTDLQTWASTRNQELSPSTTQHRIICDKYRMMQDSEQHQMGFSLFMKKYRRTLQTKQTRPNLSPIVNSRLPVYLQDIGSFNPELLNHAKTREHCTLPTKSIIADEQRQMKAERSKAWHLGLIINKRECLIDPSWKREDEEKIVSETTRKAEERSAYVWMGVLQQWKQTQETSIPIKPPSITPTSANTSNVQYEDNHSYENEKHISNQTSTEEIPATPPTRGSSDRELAGILEANDEGRDGEILRHSSR